MPRNDVGNHFGLHVKYEGLLWWFLSLPLWDPMADERVKHPALWHPMLVFEKDGAESQGLGAYLT